MKHTFRGGAIIEVVQTQALNLGNGDNYAYNIYYSNTHGERQCLARLRDKVKAEELFLRYCNELELLAQ